MYKRDKTKYFKEQKKQTLFIDSSYLSTLDPDTHSLGGRQMLINYNHVCTGLRFVATKSTNMPVFYPVISDSGNNS